jgi:hypothetical protein
LILPLWRQFKQNKHLNNLPRKKAPQPGGTVGEQEELCSGKYLTSSVIYVNKKTAQKAPANKYGWQGGFLSLHGF